MTVPILAIIPLPVPPGWALFSAAVRRAYVVQLAARGVRVDWPLDERTDAR